MTETSAIRTRVRRLKDLALVKAIDILSFPDKYSKEQYNETYTIVLKNSVPRAQEIMGEDGETIKISISKEIADKVGLPEETA